MDPGGFDSSKADLSVVSLQLTVVGTQSALLATDNG